MSSLRIEAADSRGSRLDSFLSEELEDLSRSRIHDLIRDGHILVNLRPAKPAYIPRAGDIIDIDIPMAAETDIEPEDIELDIVYEDDDLIIVNKQKGMVVHPAPGHMSHTLVNALKYHCGESLSGINGELRPGIVHRIDKDTTGLIAACKNDAAHRSLAAQLETHSMGREYIALVYGAFPETEGTVDEAIARSLSDRTRMAVCGPEHGRRAVTHYRALESFPGSESLDPMSLISCTLETGRTHQIRVHMQHIRHPLAGDETYGRRKDPFKGQGQYLHAAVLSFTHPVTHERLRFEAPLPPYFTKTLESLRK